MKRATKPTFFHAIRKATGTVSYWLIVVAVIGYTAWTMVHSIQKSYEMNKSIVQLRKRVGDLRVENENLKNLLVYYQTTTFQELEARRRLGLKKPGEKVFIIPDHQKGAVDIVVNEKLEVTPSKEQYVPKYQKWWNYIWLGGLGVED